MLVMTIVEYFSKLNLTLSTLPNFHHRLILDWRDFPSDQSFLGFCSNHLHEVKDFNLKIKNFQYTLNQTLHHINKFYIKQQYLTYLLFGSIFNTIIIAVNFSAHLLFKTRKKNNF